MGALNGTVSLRRYRIMGRPPEGYRDRFVKGVRAHALCPLDPHKNPTEDRAVGWCSIHDENDIDLDFEKFYIDGHILLGLRVDTLRPAPAEVKRQMHLRKQEEEAKRKAPLSKAALKDLKEQVMAELRKKTAPQVRTTDNTVLVVGNAPGGVIAVEVDATDTKLGVEVSRVIVRLTYSDPENNVLDTETLVFRASSEIKEWLIARADTKKGSYLFEVEYIMRDGSRRVLLEQSGVIRSNREYLPLPPVPPAS